MLLVGVNAKYIHSNLAIRYLAKMDKRCRFCEYTIADREESIAADIYKSGHRVIFFSCYIWNIDKILKICEILKKADTGFVIGLGGPEVSFTAESYMRNHPYLDYILCGEGEPSVSLLLDALETKDFDAVPGLCYRKNDAIFMSCKSAQEADFSLVPFPYDAEDIIKLKNRIVYYETSRGCPYRCAFCLSGAAGSLRFLPLERVEKEIDFFIRHKVPLVKLVDRTFNADPARALSIIEMIKAKGGSTTFHFEIRAESMTEALIQSLQKAPKNMFQIEIGVQSVNPSTLEKVNRRPNHEKLCEVVLALLQNDNIHIHLDLIAGLPGESFAEFVHSFHALMKLRPHNLQLGFLKKLKGSALEATGSQFQDFPPYEVIKSDAMSYGELLRLKAAEDMLEKFYNSGAFVQTVSYLLDTYYQSREFDFFDELAVYFEGHEGSLGQKELFEALHRFCSEHFSDKEAENRLIYDYCLKHRDSLSFMHQPKDLKERAFAFLKNETNIERYFAHYIGEKPVQLYKKLRFVPICDRVFAFDYSQANTSVDVTEAFRML